MNSELKWHDDDEFWEAFAPFMFGERMWDNAPNEVERIIKLVEAEEGTTILDLACGPGRHSLEFARRGYRVTAVDRTATFLAMARQRAEAEDLDIEFVQEDMRHFYRPETFDIALSLFTSFGYFDDPAENLQVLENINRSLKPGGKVIMDVAGKEIIARIFQERDWRQRDDVFLLEERQVGRDWGRMENRWILIDGPRRVEHRLSHWLYSAAELTQYLKNSGFTEVTIYGNLDGELYDHLAKRLIATARKPI